MRTREKANSNSLATTTTKRMVLDLRRQGALQRLQLVSAEIEELNIKQSTLAGTNPQNEETDLWEIFQAVGNNLSHLKSITIADFESTPVPIACLTMLFQNCLALSTVRMDAIRISASEDDLEELQQLATALQGHPSLQEICFSGCCPEPSNNNNNGTFTTSNFATYISKALSQLPTLQVVEIVETSFPSSRAWTGESLQCLCQSKTIQLLRIRGVRFLGDEDLVMMAKALETNHAMKELWILACEVGIMATATPASETNSKDDNDDGDTNGAQAMAQMLQVNTSLEILGLNRLAHKDHAIAIANGLRNNRTLRGLHLCLRDGGDDMHYNQRNAGIATGSTTIAESYAKLLRNDNYVLEKLSGSFLRRDGRQTSCTANRQIDFFLRLNRNGRRQRLLQTDDNDVITRLQWLEALASQSDNVSACFYWLSCNPSLCYGR
ncbi:expressed unknown protein [Seminavis robusta]|uniref:Uncharacterized protein n=1 Tax=Seminavis robusta TaxID=568900 RepID=A0A9N8HQ93_9STRA|nr:expressed unknown protein [Seminavis robusta]|eukprot:Sro1263_g257290.1 n/a (438) ;mRNA; f:29627-30940